MSKIIIFDKNRKFLNDMWIVIFKKLDVRFLYFIVYHFQTNEQNEKTNQIVEIAFRFHLIIMKKFIDWLLMFFKIQRHFNNVFFTIIIKTLNEIAYDFTSIQSFDLWRQTIDLKKFFNVDEKSFTNVSFFVVVRARIKIANFIVFAQMNVKHHYDKSHQSFYMKSKNHVYIRLHKKYDISTIVILRFKYSQQYAKFFRILKKIDRLVYRLKLSIHWRIHFVFFVTQLKSCFDFVANFFNRSRSNHFDFVFVEKNIERVKSYEIERLINKRQTKRRKTKYLMRWRDYDFENDDWRNLSKLDDVMNLIRKYEKIIRNITFLFERIKFIDTSITSSIESKNFFFVVAIRKSLRKSITSFFFVVTIRKSFSIAITQSAMKKSFFINIVSIFKQKFVVVISQKFSTNMTSIFFVVAIRKFFTKFSTVSTSVFFVVAIRKSSSSSTNLSKIMIKHLI